MLVITKIKIIKQTHTVTITNDTAEKKPRGELSSSGSVGSFCSTSGNRRYYFHKPGDNKL